MKFGILNFFEHPASAKTEHQVPAEQLETMRAAEDMGFDSIWCPNITAPNTASPPHRC
jgi:alkanesulfonate monooxygenase SsuD/methylene tetrahydromethanopterin reductase-like flavin-dependent oxidoreductase (luciferase family)